MLTDSPLVRYYNFCNWFGKTSTAFVWLMWTELLLKMCVRRLTRWALMLWVRIPLRARLFGPIVRNYHVIRCGMQIVN